MAYLITDEELDAALAKARAQNVFNHLLNPIHTTDKCAVGTTCEECWRILRTLIVEAATRGHS